MPKTIFPEVISFFATCARCGRCVGVFDRVGTGWAVFKGIFYCVGAMWAVCGRFRHFAHTFGHTPGPLQVEPKNNFPQIRNCKVINWKIL